jgi:hypothetical protein
MKKKIIYEKEEYKLQQFLLKNKKAQRDLAIHKEKLSLLEKKNELKLNKKEINNQIIECIKETDQFYFHTQKSENELINYIAILLSRIYKNSELLNPKILETYRKTKTLIEEIQEMKTNEIIRITKENENKAFELFDIKEKEQNNKLNDQIKIQSDLFIKMNEKIKEISEIKNNFSHINYLIEKSLNDKNELKIKKELIEEENKQLNILKEELTAQHNKLKEKFIKQFGQFPSFSEQENKNSPINDIYSKKLLFVKNKNKAKITNESTSLTFNSFTKNKIETNKIVMEKKNPDSNNLSNIIYYLINENKKIKNHYNDIVFIHSQIQRNHFNLKVLIEKCIEDLNYEYKKSKQINLNKDKNFDDLIYGKINQNLPDLEKSLYIFSYIHDNVIGRNRIKTLIKSNSSISINNNFLRISKI